MLAVARTEFNAAARTAVVFTQRHVCYSLPRSYDKIGMGGY